MGHNVSAGGAVGAVLGGRGAGRALKWEFIVFPKENIGFLRSGELPICPGSEVWAPSGVLDGAAGRSLALLGGFWALGGASGELRGRFLELLGAHFDALGTTLGDLGADFLGS